MKIKFIFIITTSLLLFSCSKKLLIPLSNGVFEKKHNNVSNFDVLFFIYPDSSFNVVASENCVIKSINKIEGDYIITAIGKHEISYSMLNESVRKVDEKIKRGEIIGKLKKTENNIIDPPYLMIMIKDSKGSYIENYDVFDNK